MNTYKAVTGRNRERSNHAASSSNIGSSPEVSIGTGGINTIDTLSDTSNPESADNPGPKSSASPSYCSAVDGSDISSSNSRMIHNVNGKQNTTVVAVYGAGGIGNYTSEQHERSIYANPKQES